MRFVRESMAVACCVSLWGAYAVSAKEPDAAQPASANGAGQCLTKPNLTHVVVTLASTNYMDGGQADSVKDDVLMVDFNISVENGGGVEAARSRLKYAAKVRSVAGAVVEEIDGATDIYWMAPGGSEISLVTIMVSRLTELLQPTGEIAGSIVFRTSIDVDGDVDECDETDNAAELTSPLLLEPSPV